MTENTGHIVDTLEAWYLASLRKRAVQNQANLSPSALINADRKHIEQLAYAKESDSAPSIDLPLPDSDKRLKRSLFLAGSLCLAGCAASLSTQSTVPAILSAAGAVCVFMAFKITTAYCLTPLKDLRQQLANHGERPDTYLELQPLLNKVFVRNEELEEGQSIIVDASPDGLCALDTTLQIQAVNSTLSSWLGYLKHEILGLSFKKIVLAEDLIKFENATVAAASGTTSDRLELRLLTKTGRAVDVRVSLDWSASNAAFFVCTKDISYEKRLERARAEYISTMSHDIKIPLTSALLSIESLAQHKNDTAKTERIISRAESSLERLLGLIDELLEYERSVSGKLPLRYSSAVVSELIQDAVEAVRPQAEAKQIQFQTDTTDVTIRVDKPKIERTMINLLSNAIKFSPNQGVVTIIAVKKNEMIEFVVSDNGPGIPEKYSQLIFERYERIPDSEHVEGTGLGLSICRTIVESHHGLIGVKPGKPAGSQFWFNLPINPD